LRPFRKENQGGQGKKNFDGPAPGGRYHSPARRFPPVPRRIKINRLWVPRKQGSPARWKGRAQGRGTRGPDRKNFPAAPNPPAGFPGISKPAGVPRSRPAGRGGPRGVFRWPGSPVLFQGKTPWAVGFPESKRPGPGEIGFGPDNIRRVPAHVPDRRKNGPVCPPNPPWGEKRNRPPRSSRKPGPGRPPTPRRISAPVGRPGPGTLACWDGRWPRAGPKYPGGPPSRAQIEARVSRRSPRIRGLFFPRPPDMGEPFGSRSLTAVPREPLSLAVGAPSSPPWQQKRWFDWAEPRPRPAPPLAGGGPGRRGAKRPFPAPKGGGRGESPRAPEGLIIPRGNWRRAGRKTGPVGAKSSSPRISGGTPPRITQTTGPRRRAQKGNSKFFNPGFQKGIFPRPLFPGGAKLPLGRRWDRLEGRVPPPPLGPPCLRAGPAPSPARNGPGGRARGLPPPPLKRGFGPPGFGRPGGRFF